MADVDEHATSPQVDPDEVPTGYDDARRWVMGRIGHRLRTPLSLVAATTDLLRSSGGLSDQDREHVMTLHGAATALARHVEHLLEAVEWPRDDAHEPFVLAPLVSQVVDPLRTDARDRHDVQVEFTGSSDVAVVAHPEVLAWALRILVWQAVQRAAPEGHVHTTVEDCGGDVVTVRIRATEAGTDPATGELDSDMARLALAMLDASWADASMSLDNGLVATIELAAGPRPSDADDSAKGLDTDGPPGWALPAVGAGNASLPTPPADRADERPAVVDDHETSAGPAPPGRDADLLSVLVVEDDDALREFLHRTLSSDYRVVAVATAEDALDAARRTRPDLIICDIMLPGASGEALVTALNELDPLSQVPIIVLTGRTDEQLRVRLLRDGADDYITKPFVLDELKVRMANLASEQLGIEELRRSAAEAQELAGQLQHALTSRIVIEQAKAFIAAEHDIDVDDAFELLRQHARSNQARLHDVARAVVEARRPPPE